MTTKKPFVCVLCERTTIGQWGNNAWPCAVGKCCDRCDERDVLIARLSLIYGRVQLFDGLKRQARNEGFAIRD